MIYFKDLNAKRSFRKIIFFSISKYSPLFFTLIHRVLRFWDYLDFVKAFTELFFLFTFIYTVIIVLLFSLISLPSIIFIFYSTQKILIVREKNILRIILILLLIMYLIEASIFIIPGIFGL